MNSTMFSTLLAAATVTVETPIDGSTGVWIKQGATVISSAMKMTGVTVSSGQTQYIYSRGVASGCSVLSGGLQYVSNGGVAKECDVFAYQHVSSGGTAINCIAHLRQYISAGGSALGTVLRDPTDWPSNYQALSIVSGGYASGITGDDHAVLWIASNARSAYDFIISSGGTAQLYTNALLDGAVVLSGGTLNIPNAGSAIRVDSRYGAVVNVAAGGYVEYITA